MKKLILAAACAALAAIGALGAEKKVRAAVFVDQGARAVGAFRWLQITTLAKDYECIPVDAEMIRKDALANADVLIMPGGRSVLEAKMLGNEGRDKIRAFIKNGGGYVGTCAGCFLAMQSSKSHPNMLGIIPYKDGVGGGHADMMLKFNEQAKTIAGIKPGTHRVRFAGGPVLLPADPVADAQFTIVGTYDSDINLDSNKPRESMAGKGAAAAGTYGKGRVFVYAVHPEYDEDDNYLVQGALKYVTGVEPQWVLPQRRRGELAVGVWCPNSFGVETAKLLQKLIRKDDPACSFDLQPLNADHVNDGALDHLDAFLVPNGVGIDTKTALKGKSSGYARAFLARGGRIVTWGAPATAVKALGPQARIFKTGEEAVKDLHALAGEPVKFPDPIVVPASTGRVIRCCGYYGPGGANFSVAPILSLSPGFTYTAIGPEDYRKGELSKYDFVLQPGGGCNTQAVALKREGTDKLIEFVRNGGRYYGICAGAFLATQPSDKRYRMGLVPFKHVDAHYRGWAEIKVKFTEAGLKLFSNRDKIRSIQYWGGPVLQPGTPVEDTDIQVLGEYYGNVVNTCSPKPIPPMTGCAAFLGGRVGKGKVFISAPHPEMHGPTYDIVYDVIHYLTGRRPQPIATPRVRGALSVSINHIHAPAVANWYFGKLIHDRRFDVVCDDLDANGSPHFDVRINTEPASTPGKLSTDFAEHGGTLIVLTSDAKTAEAWQKLPNTKIAASVDEIIPALAALMK